MGYSLFQSSTLGMMSQAHALDTLGTNIANVTTGGFKRTDTRFATVLSGTIRTGPGQDSAVSFANQENGLGGVRPKDFQTVDQQGLIRATERDLDVAIAGEGFFQVSPTLQVTNQILFTRDGSFEINIAGPTVPALGDDGSTINVRQGFLADKNGFFLLGVTPQADGTFANASTLTPLRVDQFAVANNFTPTTQATLNVNLPANKLFGEASENTSLTVIDSNGLARALTAEFVKTPTDNQWQLELSGDGLTNFTLGPGAAFSLATGAGPPSTGRILQLDPVTREIRVKRELFPTVGSPGAFIGLKVGDQITVAGAGVDPSNVGPFTIGAISSDFSTIT
ncbi:MAG: flagellar hook-basal body complex protein, partial [Rhodospirillales bacterium]